MWDKWHTQIPRDTHRPRVIQVKVDNPKSPISTKEVKSLSKASDLENLEAYIVSLVNSTKHWKRHGTTPTQTLPEMRGEDMSQLILWGRCHPSMKTMREPSTNISKLNLGKHKKDNTPRPSEVYSGHARLVPHSKINQQNSPWQQIKEKPYDRSSQSMQKNQWTKFTMRHPFMIPTLDKLGSKGNFFHLIKRYPKNPNITVSDERLNVFPA